MGQGFFARPFAHRALHGPGRPENSASALRAAVVAGFGIEIDVQLSADQRAMVFHDYDLARLAHATGAIQTHSAADLARVRLRGSDEGVPTLEEALEIVAGQVPLCIEIKDQDGALGPNVGALETAVAEALQHYQGPVAVMSFNPHSVAQMARLCPDVPRGLTSSAYLAQDWPLIPAATRAHLATIPLEGLGASFISHEAADLSNARVAQIRAQGLSVLCWTIRSEAQAAQALTYADQITFEDYLPA